MDWVVYILKCADDTLYTGITNDLAARVTAHQNGVGAKYTRGRGPFAVLYTENLPDRSAASKRESQIKAMDRAAKYDLVQQHNQNE